MVEHTPHILKIWEKSIIEPTLKNILLKIWEKKYYWTNAHVLKNILLKIWEKKLCWRIFYWRFEKKSIIEPTHICWRIFYWRFKKKILLNQRTYVEEYILSLTITKSKKLLGHRHGTGPDWTLNPTQHCYGRQLWLWLTTGTLRNLCYKHSTPQKTFLKWSS